MGEALKVLTAFIAETAETAAATAETTAKAGATPAVAASGNLVATDAEAVAQSAAPKDEKKSLVPKMEKPNIGIKVPGGITAILLFILFMIFAVIPVNGGQTRLQLLWSVIARGGYMRGDMGTNPSGGTGTNDEVEKEAVPSLFPPTNDIDGWYLDPLRGGWVKEQRA